MQHRRKNDIEFIRRRLENDVVHRGSEVILRDSTLLKDSTITQGQYERAMKELLIEMGLIVFYEPVKFEIEKSNKPKAKGIDTYPPDFVTTMFVDKKQVIIELHGADTEYFKRMGRFRETHGDRFYYILVKSDVINPENVGIEKGKESEHGAYVDECWNMPRIRQVGADRYDEGEQRLWKEKMRSALIEFINQRTDKCVDWEAAAALIHVKRAS